MCIVTVLVYSGLRWLRRRASRAVAICLLLVATLYVKDPICGMTVDETSALRAERDGQTKWEATRE